ncbi:hypothetical protein DIPPA_32303 [Diplonema papillatum]|nr:hypothetical protein DIPPA_32303 [Diplonema papillatum]
MESLAGARPGAVVAGPFAVAKGCREPTKLGSTMSIMTVSSATTWLLNLIPALTLQDQSSTCTFFMEAKKPSVMAIITACVSKPSAIPANPCAL